MESTGFNKPRCLIRRKALISMKILLTVHQFFPESTAGTEVLTYSVARELLKRGHEVHVLSGKRSAKALQEAERFDEYDIDGIHVYRFHHAYTPMGGQTSIVKVGYDNQLAAAYFAHILERFKPAVVHFFHLSRLGTGLIDKTVLASVPAFMTPTDFWTICPTGQLLLDNGKVCSGPSKFAGNCLKHIAQSTQEGLMGKAAGWIPTAGTELLARLTEKRAIPTYPYQEEVLAVGSRLEINIARLNQLHGLVVPNDLMKTLLIQHGVSPQLIIQSAFGIDLATSITNIPRTFHQHPLRIGFIGTLAQHKGCHVLIDAFKTLPKGCAVLNIYGGMKDFPSYSSLLKRRAANSDAITFCGQFHNSIIGEVLADIDVLVVPSLWYENTPLVVYSAQAARCPVVASDFPGISSVIRDDENGLLFEAGNATALARQLNRLIDEQNLVMQLSNNAQRPKSTASYVDELLTIWTTT